MLSAIALAPCGSAQAQSSQVRRASLKKDIARASAFIRSPRLRREKHQKMAASPFTFFRATAYLYTKDIAGGLIKLPAVWESAPEIQTWIQGDLHIQNLGFSDVNRALCFDLNDLDEAHRGPFTHDILRFLTSIFLAREDFGFRLSESDVVELCKGFMESYKDQLRAVRGSHDELKSELAIGDLRGFMKRRAKKLAKRNQKRLLAKYTSLSAGGRSFDLGNPKIGLATAPEQRQLRRAFPNFRASLALKARSAAGDFKIKGIAKRLDSGLGSLGVRKLYVLCEGRTAGPDDDLLYEVKEQRIPSWSSKGALEQAQRVLDAHRFMLRRVDAQTGALRMGRVSFLVRRISAQKGGFDAVDFKSLDDLKCFLGACAQAIALAHSRADKDAPGSGIHESFEKQALEAFKSWPRVGKTLIGLARDYARRVREDHRLFLALRADGELD